MLDNLREDANASSLFEDDESELPDFLEDIEDEEASGSASSNPIMLLTPLQRFILVALFFSAVCLIGSMALLVLGKFVLPI